MAARSPRSAVGPEVMIAEQESGFPPRHGEHPEEENSNRTPSRQLRLVGRLRQALRSPALGVAFIHGVSGLAFVVANLLFARALSPSSYGELALVIAIVNLAMPLAPAGADGVVNRRPLPPHRRLFVRVILTSTVVALAASVIGLVTYGLDAAYVAAIAISVVGGGTAYLAAAQFQSGQRFGMALSISQSVNGFLALAGMALVVGWFQKAETVAFTMAAGLGLSSLVGWVVLYVNRSATESSTAEFSWREALSYAGVSGAILLLLQLERLVIPVVLTLEDLAVFGVLASVVGAPFRMMQQGLSFTLFPRLRAAEALAERRRILRNEGVTAAAVLLAGGSAIWFATPLIIEFALEGKYELPDALVLAALVSGTLKVLDAFSKSSVSALGTVRELSLFNFLGWGAVTVGVVAGVVAARWGLVGVIYGVGAGWAARSVIGACLAMPHMRAESGKGTASPVEERLGP